MRYEWALSAALGVLSAGASASATAQSEFACAQLPEDEATPCLHRVAWSDAQGADPERAIELHLRMGERSVADELMERLWAERAAHPLSTSLRWRLVELVGEALEGEVASRREDERVFAWREVAGFYARWRSRLAREAAADVRAASHERVAHALLRAGVLREAHEGFVQALRAWLPPSERARLTGFARYQPFAQVLARASRGTAPRETPQRGGGSGIVSPFGALTETEPRLSVQQALSGERSVFTDESVEQRRGRRAAARAWLGLAHIASGELGQARFPALPARADADALWRWTEREVTPLIAAMRELLERQLTVYAMAAIATHLPEVELEAAALMAGGFMDFARMIRRTLPPPAPESPRITLMPCY